MFVRILIAAAVFSTAPAMAADEEKEKLRKEFGESLTRCADALKTVKDKATANEAKKTTDELDEIVAKVAVKYQPKGKPILAERSYAFAFEKLGLDKNDKAIKAAFNSISETHGKISLKNQGAYFVLYKFSAFRHLRQIVEDEALSRAQKIRDAIAAYYDKNGRVPENLLLLIEDNGKDKPFLAGGEKALIDPWDQHFSYCAEKIEKSDPPQFKSTVITSNPIDGTTISSTYTSPKK